MVADGSLVLIVSHDPDMVQTLSRLVEQVGWALAKAETGAEALDLHQRLHPHLIVLDAMLPDLDGVEVCRKLQALPDSAGTPVVMIGAAGQDQPTIDRALAAGVADYIDRAAQTQWSLLGRRIQYLVRTAQAEEALARERHHWQTLIDNLPDYIYVKDTQSRFAKANLATALGMGAASAAELVGRTDFDFYPHELATRYYRDEQALLHSGQRLINQEEPVLDQRTGETGWFLSTKVPLKDSQGTIVGLVGIGRNITAHKRMEETLERERTLLRTLIDHVPDYIFAKDRAGRFLISNEAHAQAVKASAKELIGKTAFDLFPAPLAAQFHTDDEALMQSGETLINADRRTVDSSGAERQVLTTKVPMMDGQGQVIGLVGISRDVTEYKHVQEALAQERALLRTLIDNLPDNIFVKDAQGRIIIDNVAHSTLLGLSTPEAAIGRTDFDFFPEELASQYFADEQAVIQSGQPLINREEQTVNPAGAKRWLLTTKVPLRNSQGEITGIVGINRDITDRKRPEGS